MARKRMIDPDFWLDEDLAKLSTHARLLYIGLWGICDDSFATFPDRPDWIKAQIFPYDTVDLPNLLAELEKANKIIAFINDKKKYWYVKNFLKWQRVEHPSVSKYPKYLALTEGSPRAHRGLRPRSIRSINSDQSNSIQSNYSDQQTPAEKARIFFKNPEVIIETLASKGLDKAIVRNEIKKFVAYWTELNKTGRKQRWELEKTFEINRRLATWFGNYNKFNKNSGRKILKI